MDDDSHRTDCESRDDSANKPINPPQVQDESKSKNPPNPPLVPPAEHRPENNEHTKETWKDLTKWGKFERVFKVIEFLGLFGGIYLIGYQGCKMAQATDATVTQSKILQGQLNEMQKGRNLDERAWVSPGQITSSNDNTGTVVWMLHYENNGRTPALHLQSAFQVDYSHNFIPDTNMVVSNIGGQILYPNVIGQVGYPMPFDLYDGMSKNRVPAYAHGYFKFFDIFGVPHWIRFSLVVDLRTGITYPDGTGNECDTNN